MIKIKISDVKDFRNSDIPQEFGVTLKNSKETMKGKLIIDMPVNLIQLNDMPRALTDDERLALIKEIFYDFCITDFKFNATKVEGEIENYYFIDYNNVKTRKTLMQQIMEYELGRYTCSKKKEKILCNVLVLYKEIKNKTKGNDDTVQLDPLYGYTRGEIKTIIRILNALLQKEGYKGHVEDVSYKYETPMEFGIPYYGHNFYSIFALEYYVNKY